MPARRTGLERQVASFMRMLRQRTSADEPSGSSADVQVDPVRRGGPRRVGVGRPGLGSIIGSRKRLHAYRGG